MWEQFTSGNASYKVRRIKELEEIEEKIKKEKEEEYKKKIEEKSKKTVVKIQEPVYKPLNLKEFNSES